MRLSWTREHWKLSTPFVISRERIESVQTLHVTLSMNGFTGHGEAAGIPYYGETMETMAAQLEQSKPAIENNPDHKALAQHLPAGGARNAVDCAWWDLTAKMGGQRVWDRLNTPMKPVHTVFTIGIDEPEAMAAKASRHAHFPVLKVKVGGEGVVERIGAVAQAAPNSKLLIDPNQSWSIDTLNQFAPQLVDLNVVVLEQPIRQGEDELLREYCGAIDLCADESCNTSTDIAVLAGLYQLVNIKLDKTGGLTEALALAHGARSAGLDLMVGNMCGSSLAMAPAMIIAQQCHYIDLDGPLLQRNDRQHPMVFDGPMVHPPPRELWG